jgi:hypothetical protein
MLRRLVGIRHGVQFGTPRSVPQHWFVYDLFLRDIETKKATTMDIRTNTFCASGMHLPNGSFATFGGNSAVGPKPNAEASQQYPWGGGIFDDTYKDYDGRKSIRILDPCDDESCSWFDNPDALGMQKQRWYSAAEPLADGTIALLGGFVSGGYINRNYPDNSKVHETQDGAAEPTSEFYPANGREARLMPFLVETMGLNAYAHTFLLPSGKMLVQANVSTMIWDPETNEENRLPDMPGGVARVYPASGAVAMLPLRPKNGYNPTILFCGGQNIPDELWGNYANPVANTWTLPASPDCQRLTPEPTDGSLAAYEQDDDMIQGRTMGQFVILPTGKFFLVNGGANGTAGYSTQTGQTPNFGDMPFGMSLASDPTLKPAIYDPDAPKGSRWSDEGLSTSSIPRLYHSSAILLPDASVLIAGSNPNLDVNLTTYFPTTYQAEIFYPPYFHAKVRPEPSGVPSKLTYGGPSFDVTIPASSYSGSSNDAADNTTIVLVRTGWTTHGMNMGQRFLQLNNTYAVHDDGSIELHVSQLPPQPEIFQPGPAFVYVVVNGIPSTGTYVIVGSGKVEPQARSEVAALPDKVRVDTAKGSASSDSTNSGGSGSSGGHDSGSSQSSTSKAVLIGAIVGGVAAIGILATAIGICISSKRKVRRAMEPSYGMSDIRAEGGGNDSGGRGFVRLQQNESDSQIWGTPHPATPSIYVDQPANASTQGLQSAPYYPSPGVGR